ncbi:hypothetical protein SAMN04488522_104543 [Pedobacter caeni]|uniref:Uncharacterized protein n=1 Tax=Pedobacter caeni TaxID=288992 RepID=A0A1M5H868_9SPHI|nr:hypothetical protein SAMN04488522_104543 [Pedobacter caeni]
MDQQKAACNLCSSNSAVDEGLQPAVEKPLADIIAIRIAD